MSNKRFGLVQRSMQVMSQLKQQKIATAALTKGPGVEMLRTDTQLEGHRKGGSQTGISERDW